MRYLIPFLLIPVLAFGQTTIQPLTQSNIEAAITDDAGFRTAIGAATAAQGTLADTALQPASILTGGGTITPKSSGNLDFNNLGASYREDWVFEGDSWTAGTAQGNDRETYPYYLNLYKPGYVTTTNVATAGQTAATMVSTFSAQVAPNLTATTGRPSTCFIFAGINDSAGTVNDLRTNLRLLWTSARNAGARVVAATLPARSAVGGWPETDRLTINANIEADSSYYDVLVRTHIVFNNPDSPEFTDGIHVTTAAHAKLASRFLDAMWGRQVMPSTPSDLTCNTCSTTALSAATRRNLPFDEVYDANNDATSATVGSDSNVRVFTAPVDGTYEISGNLLLGSLASGDNAYLTAWITPISTGVEVEHRLHYNLSAGANMGLCGMKRVRMARGDKLNLSIQSSKASTSVLSNGNFSTFNVRLVSIP